ncbi:MAG TPA: glutamine--tRNA ligase, partial [Polyangiaceae bacterium]
SAAHAKDVEVRIYDRLCSVESPGEGGRDFLLDLNPTSLTLVQAKVEPSLAAAQPGEHYQFERLGFFVVDPDTQPGAPVFNRTVALKDSWAKAAAAKPEAKPKAAKPAGAPKPAAEEAELPPVARALVDEHGIDHDEARALTGMPSLLALFEAAIHAKAPARAAASLLSNDVLGELRARKLEAAPFDGAAVAELLGLSADGTLSTKLAKDVLAEMFGGGGAPRAIVEKKGLKQITDVSVVESAVDGVLAANAETVARYKAGNANVFGALVGMVMKASGGRANPKLVSEALKKKLI